MPELDLQQPDKPKLLTLVTPEGRKEQDLTESDKSKDSNSDDNSINAS